MTVERDILDAFKRRQPHEAVVDIGDEQFIRADEIRIKEHWSTNSGKMAMDGYLVQFLWKGKAVSHNIAHGPLGEDDYIRLSGPGMVTLIKVTLTNT